MSRERQTFYRRLATTFWVPAVLSLIVFAMTYFGPPYLSDFVIKAVPGFLVLYVGFMINFLGDFDDEIGRISGTVSDNREKDLKETEDVITALSSISDNLEASLDHVRFAGDFAQKANRLSEKSELVSVISKEAMAKFIDEFKIFEAEDTVKFTGEGPAIAAYTKFWESLRISQEHKKNAVNQVIARITHSNSIDIWLDEGLLQGEALLSVRRHERKFVVAKGTVFRILVRLPSEAHEYPLEKYLEAANRMKSRGIIPAIIDVGTSNSIVADDAGYDFITADGLEERISLRWLSSGSARYIGGCLVSSSAKIREDHEAIWDEYIEYLKTSSYDEKSETISNVKKMNENFISEYSKLF